jgi:HD-like signal output (HDOD) protein
MALPFLSCNRSEDYDPILEKWHTEGGNLAQLERESFEWDHAEVASWICSEWGLPENIALAIRDHHVLESGDDHDTLVPVKLVAILRENESNDGVDEMIAEAENRYNITEEKMRALIETSFEKAKDLAKMIA